MRLEHLLSGDAIPCAMWGAVHWHRLYEMHMCMVTESLLSGVINSVSVLSFLCLLDITWEDLCGCRLLWASLSHGQSPIAQLVRAPH